MKEYSKYPSERQLFLDQDERDICCNEGKPGVAVQPKDCVDVWKLKLNDAREAKETAFSKYDKAKKTYDSAASWKSKLKNWKESAENAHDKVIDAYQELNLFKEAVERTKTVETAKAVKAVLCLVKSIFDDVDGLLRVSNEEPKGGIQELKHWIECDESLDANKKQKALNCIVPFEDQMKIVNGAQADLLTKLLEILKGANLLVAAVEKTGAEEKGDITWQLEDLENRISGKTTYTARERKCGVKTEPSFEPPCESDIINPTKHYLPIRNSDYYCNIVDLFKKAEVKEKESKDALEVEEGKYNDAAAYYKGLDDAINAAEAAKSTK
ncbi:hypothetical protein [Nitrosomonas sp.]|uniref:hypothetical protein n=1 Tax=Nitrosomonas sp. TaxID=42353 RepID=UPI002609577C|nr:hypothetical protein [Nitrosomonas sp.]MCW5599974.1 hypothetical protein [Nitrosomonas sp.]